MCRVNINLRPQTSKISELNLYLSPYSVHHHNFWAPLFLSPGLYPIWGQALIRFGIPSLIQKDSWRLIPNSTLNAPLEPESLLPLDTLWSRGSYAVLTIDQPPWECLRFLIISVLPAALNIGLYGVSWVYHSELSGETNPIGYIFASLSLYLYIFRETGFKELLLCCKILVW